MSVSDLRVRLRPPQIPAAFCNSSGQWSHQAEPSRQQLQRRVVSPCHAVSSVPAAVPRGCIVSTTHSPVGAAHLFCSYNRQSPGKSPTDPFTLLTALPASSQLAPRADPNGSLLFREARARGSPSRPFALPLPPRRSAPGV